MIPNNAIKNLIRDDKVHQIYSAMQIGQEDSNMRTMNQSLLNLIMKRKISEKVGLSISPDASELNDLMNKSQRSDLGLKQSPQTHKKNPPRR